MGASYKLLLDGAEIDADLHAAIGSVEVEENVELPGAIQLTLPVAAQGDDLSHTADPALQPHAHLAVVVNADGKPSECIFDGYVLSHKLHLEKGATDSSLTVWGQDASWIMNLEEKVHEWADMTDAAVAGAIFDQYGITAAPENTTDDSPAHVSSGHTLMQRGSDIQFLRRLARRSGKVCRVAAAQEPGKLVGYFVKPNLEGEPVLTLSIHGEEPTMVTSLDIEWDVARPTAVTGQQATFSAPDPILADATDSGLPPLEARDLATFAGKPMKVLLSSTADDAGELLLRARAVLRDSGFFVRCSGEADGARLNAVIRAGTVVKIDGAGSLHSGKYYVWSVRHTLKPDSHKMSFVLVRNAVGAPAGGTS
ncbi:MAG: contractile injection system protein, VgrG/Pvc8 family [Minicystis sp.]